MHAPPLHKKKSWQRFLAGAFIGAIIAYLIFLYMYGSMYENLFEKNLELQSEIDDLKSRNEVLLQDKKDLDEKQDEAHTVDSIEMTITNHEKLDIDRLLTHELEGKMKENISHVIGQDIETVAESVELLISTIENKKIDTDDFTYQFKVTRLIVANTLQINMKGEPTD